MEAVMKERKRIGSRRNLLKWCLDGILIFLFVLMFRKRVISMRFHEIGGLVLLGVIVLHIVLNYRFIFTVTKKIFCKAIPGKTKLGYVIDICLLILFVLIGVSGAMMSKVVFSFNGGSQWKTIHYTSSALTLVLIGIHVGLHWNYIKGIGKKILPLPSKVSKPLGYLVMIAFLAFGSYSLVTSSFSQWITMPFGISGTDRNGEGQGNRSSAGNEGKNKQGNRPSMGDGIDNSDNSSITSGTQFNRNEMRGEIQSSGFRFTILCQVVATFLSIVVFFSILTYWLEVLIRKVMYKNSVVLQEVITRKTKEIPLIEQQEVKTEDTMIDVLGAKISEEEEANP